MIPDGPSGVTAQTAACRSLVLKHFKGKTNEKSKDVTTLDWNVSIHICRNRVILPFSSLQEIENSTLISLHRVKEAYLLQDHMMVKPEYGPKMVRFT